MSSQRVVLSVLGMMLFASFPAEAQKEHPWISMRDGRLVYYADAHGNRIPDFSTVGYEEGNTPVPTVPVRLHVDGQPDTIDDTARLQKAIDEVSRMAADSDGFRGAVLLSPGEFRIAGTLLLNRSGVVLRGSGSGQGGTHLHALGAPHRLIWVKGEGEWTQLGEKHLLMDPIVPVGASSITVAGAAQDFHAGDRIILQWSMPQRVIHEIGMDHIAGRKDGREVTEWSPDNMGLRFDRTIVSVEAVSDGLRLRLNAALTQEMHREDNATVWQYEFSGRIDHVGIESLSADAASFTHDNNFDHPIEPPKSRAQPTTPHREDGSFFSSIFTDWDAVENGWMRDIYTKHFNNIVVVDAHARALTFRDITSDAVDTPEHRNHSAPFAYQVDGQQILMQRCNAGGRLNHVWATQARVAGPNVFRDGVAVGFDLDAGPHHRWATGVLYENLRLEGKFDAYNQEGLGTGHGWAGAYNVFYNDVAKEWQIESPPGAYNWVIGSTGGTSASGHGNISPQWQSHGKPVLPESLYLQQLQERRAVQKK